MRSSSTWKIWKDSWVDQDSLCANFEDALDVSLLNERNYISLSMSENTKTVVLSISQEPKKAGRPTKKKSVKENAVILLRTGQEIMFQVASDNDPSWRIKVVSRTRNTY